MGKRSRVIILGIMGRTPFAGVAWQALHYVKGFRRLGFDVYYVEDSGEWAYDPEQNTVSHDCTYALNYISRLMTWCGLPDRWAYRAVEPERAIFGLSESQFRESFQCSDAFINLIGSTILRVDHLLVPLLIYLETDTVPTTLVVAKVND